MTSIGKRVSYSGNICTILWSGELAGTQTQWYGVEWDDPTRGKHDGQYNGTRYFFCQFPTSGSFVKQSRKIDGQKTFVDAVNEKYGNANNPRKTITWGTKVVEEVGFEKIEQIQADFSKLQIVNLDSMLLSSPQPVLSGPKICPNVSELDLSRNLFSHFEDVARICRGLDRVQILRLNANRLSEFKLEAEFAGSFKNVKLLSLNRNWLVWNVIVQISEYFPSLEELQLSANFISTIEVSPLMFPRLKTLHLQDNRLTDWSKLTDLSLLKSLNYLNLSGNQLSKIPTALHQIEYLDISDNKFHSWSEISSLENWSSLNSLRVFPNPIFTNETSEHSRLLVIGSIQRLQSLNGTKITQNERMDAELYCLSITSKSRRPEEGSKITEPRWTQLSNRYGYPNSPVSLKSKPKTITFQYKGHKRSKRILSSMTVAMLKGLCAKLFELDAGSIRLIYNGEEINDGMKSIEWYGIEEDAEILVCS